MRRWHLFEVHDSRFCPAEVRNTVTDLLQHSIQTFAIFRPVETLLSRVVERTKARRIVDLCSGGGGPWLSLHTQVPVRLTDKFPNLSAFQRVSSHNERIAFEEQSVDATAVPEELDGFRTLFSSFHHFRPEQARAILFDAVERGQGIAVCELTRRDPLAVLFMVFSAVAALLSVPVLRPFRWSRLFWTYIVPLIPLVFTIDGIVSCLRTYSVDELRALTGEFPEYDWQIGEIRGGRWPIPVTYLIGSPKAAEFVPGWAGAAGRVAQQQEAPGQMPSRTESSATLVSFHAH